MSIEYNLKQVGITPREQFDRTGMTEELYVSETLQFESSGRLTDGKRTNINGIEFIGYG